METTTGILPRELRIDRETAPLAVADTTVAMRRAQGVPGLMYRAELSGVRRVVPQLVEEPMGRTPQAEPV